MNSNIAEWQRAAAGTSSSTNVVWVSATRLTHIDVQCVCNTHSVQLNDGSKNYFRASMPYKPTKSFNVLPKGSTHFQKYKLDDGRREQTETLKNEMLVFFEQLQNERNDRLFLEHYSSTKIQALFRGFRRRFKMKNCIPRKLNPRTQHQIQEELCYWAQLLNLKPLRGLSLENKSQTSKRFAKIQKAAAMRMQRFFKMLVARTKARKYMNEIRILQFNKAAVQITRFIRRLRQHVIETKAKNMNKANAAITIQCCFRCFKAIRRYYFYFFIIIIKYLFLYY